MADTEVAGNARALCRLHKIALNNDGRCVLCRRDNDAVPEEPANPWPLIGLVVVFGCIGLGVYWLSQQTSSPPPIADPVLPQPVSPETEEPVMRVEEPGVAASPRPNARDRRDAFQRERQEREEDILAAMKNIPIKMFSTKACKSCGAARKWFEDKGYSFTDLDVEEDGRHLRELERVNPDKTVPTFVVGETMLQGFSSRLLSRTLRTQAEAIVDE